MGKAVPWRDWCETGVERLEQSWRKTLSVSGFDRPDPAGRETLGTALGHVVETFQAEERGEVRVKGAEQSVGQRWGPGRGGKGAGRGVQLECRISPKEHKPRHRSSERVPRSAVGVQGAAPAQLQAPGWVSGEGSSPLGLYG